tara:strand:- start:25711 stop:28995 length:3285 start_codon:yes stop_codon:yes gene_type:complete
MRLLIFVVFTFFGLASFSQIVINEYSAANYDGFNDNYGENEDWFELYNASLFPINLNGYYVSDKNNNLTKWQFTSDVNINPNEHIVIYCSGRNEINGGGIHTNFKLHQTKGNEWIILTDPDGTTIIDSVFVKPCLTNSSRGRLNYSDNSKGVFINPSPANINIGGFIEYATKPSFSPIPGIYANTTNVTISTDPSLTIFYTTDGSLPDNTDNQYNGPISINNTTVLKAVAYSSDPDILPSFMEFGTYFIGVSHTVKILSISGRESDNPNNPELYELIAGGIQIEPNGTFELYNKDGSLFDKARGEFNEHGNDSWAYQQRGFDYITRDQFGYNYAIKGEVFNDIDRDRFQRFIVKCAANDNYPFSYGSSGAHIRDAYVQSLSQVAKLRLDERSHESCVMYLNGEYWGVYELREKVDDLDYTDKYYDQDSVAFLKTWGGTWVDVLTDGQNPNDVENLWDDIRNYITTNDMSIQANYEYAKDRYNVGSLIDYFILNSYVVNSDWLNWNTAWWRGLKEDGDKKKWRYALWDMDNTFDHGANYTGIPNDGPDADPCDPESLGNIGGQGHIPIWNALIENEEFFDNYINRWSNLSNSYLSCEFMIAHLDSLIGIIEPEMQDQIDTWGGTYNEWMDNVNDMKEFMNDRCTFLNAAIVDCYDVEGPFNVNVVIDGIGEVDFNNFFDVNESNTPLNGEFFGGIDIDFSVTSGNFSYYEIISNDNYNYNETDMDFSLELLGDITIVFYFDANEITFIVEPAGSGSMSIDGNSITAFPYTQSYTDNSNILLNAQPNQGWEMDFWSSTNHSFLPTTNDENVSAVVNSSDTIVLHLNQQSYNLTYVVEPSNALIDVEINGNPINIFPYSTTEFYGTNINLEAKSNVGWDFLYMTSKNGYISGQSISPFLSFNVDKEDTITIYYDENIFYDITYEIYPEASGQINANNILIGDTIEKITYPLGELLNLEAIASYGWRFSHWDNNTNILNPNKNETNINLNVESSDNIVANFSEMFEVFVPNSFTPSNNDNLHNTFNVSIFSTEGVKFEMKIFNRFGESIFESDDESIAWDGSYNGRQVPAGIYMYLLTVESNMTGNRINKKGTITLLR